MEFDHSKQGGSHTAPIDDIVANGMDHDVKVIGLIWDWLGLVALSFNNLYCSYYVIFILHEWIKVVIPEFWWMYNWLAWGYPSKHGCSGLRSTKRFSYPWPAVLSLEQVCYSIIVEHNNKRKIKNNTHRYYHSTFLVYQVGCTDGAFPKIADHWEL